MIAPETLQRIDLVAEHHALHPQDVRDLLSEQLPGWITPDGQVAAQSLLQAWLQADVDIYSLLDADYEAEATNATQDVAVVSKRHLFAETTSPYNQLAERRATKNFTQRLVERFGFSNWQV
jgi:hypothetical protein